MENRYDLVVVGTGFASTFFLKKYLDKAPLNSKVLVLDRGHLFPHRDRLRRLAGEEPASSKLNPNHGDTFINKNPDKHWVFTHGFGGSSNCWYACTPRFMPSDFKMKSLYGIASDWPINYDDLAPYYDEVEKIMDIAGPDETPFPRNGPYPLPAHSLSTVDKVLQKKFGKLYISQPTARASRAVNGRNACCASASCSICPVDAKFTIENSNLGVYNDERVKLVAGAQVYALEFNNDLVQKVLFVKDGKELTAEGEVVALGTHALFNASILLNSKDKSPFTGKGLGEQYGLDAIVHLKDLDNVGGSTWATANGYMLYEGDHRKEYAACLMESNNAPYIRIERGKWRQIATFRMIFEDLPSDDNFVKTGDDKLVPEVHFNGVSAYTQKAVSRMKEMLPDVLACLPVEKISFLEPFKSEAHILGTTRMGLSSSDSVVDKNLIHHHYRNLFVLGSGAFTTYSPNNPTLTLSALSLMAADHSF